MMTLRLKARYRVWKAKRKLEKSGYSSWRVYRHCRDSNVHYQAMRVSDYYCGYKHVYVADRKTSYAYSVVHDYGPGGIRFGYEDMRDWCESKCRFKYRIDIHRVYDDTFNDIGGIDFVYFAFMNEQDYMMFLLRWS